VRSLISRTAAVAAALLLLTAAACGGGGDTQSAEPAEQASSRTPAEQSASPSPESSGRQAATTIETARSEFGEILVDSEGMTLYMFDPDRGGESTCEGDCLVAWPPVEGPAEAGAGVDDSMLGTTKATDGTTMATYNDWPLYYWVDDKRPGDVTGQAVNDVWWVLGPDGEPIRQMP
jgi:predicted lipoprotein with Yx(FWY)xxD motif